MRVRLVPLDGGSPVEIEKDLIIVGRRVRRAALLPNDQLFIASVRFSVDVAHDDEPLSSNEYTQQLDGKDLKKLLEKSERPGEVGSDSEVDLPAVQANPLPDVYPPEPAKQK
jgi:hypothetical protein